MRVVWLGLAAAAMVAVAGGASAVITCPQDPYKLAVDTPDGLHYVSDGPAVWKEGNGSPGLQTKTYACTNPAGKTVVKHPDKLVVAAQGVPAPGVPDVPGLPRDGLPVVPGVPRDVPGVPHLPGLPRDLPVPLL